jgi:hypothetical protein
MGLCIGRIIRVLLVTAGYVVGKQKSRVRRGRPGGAAGPAGGMAT